MQVADFVAGIARRLGSDEPAVAQMGSSPPAGPIVDHESVWSIGRSSFCREPTRCMGSVDSVINAIHRSGIAPTSLRYT